jgi:amino acid adenylation domain-containing protein
MRPLATRRMSRRDERHRMVVAWNSTRAPYPDTKCIHQLFEAQVAKTPNALALSHGNQELSYRELNQRANQLAHHLRKLGVGPNRLVGICMPRRVEMIVGLLAALKAGGAYVPLDPTYPPKRLADMVNDVPVQVLLTTQDLLATLPTQGATVVCVDRDWSAIARESAEPSGHEVSVHSLAYVIFTSGSTGRPKAAAVCHRGWTNLMHWFVTELNVQSADRVLVISSFGFDITQRSIVMPLMTGGQLHLAASPVYDPMRVRQTIAERRITLLNCSPSMFYLMIEQAGEATFRQLRSLRVLILGGEAISAPRLREWAESDGCATDVVNVYGVAECTDVSTWYRLTDYQRYAATSVPIGKPIFNSQVYILDDHLAPVPFGAPGQICIAGDGVGQGYLNDETLTAEKFVANPFSDEPGARLYTTGDLGRFLPDWNLEFVGRVDFQVKVNGVRIDLGDIETALRQHARIREAVVLSKETAPGDQRLVAFVVPRQRWTTHELSTELRPFLKDRLPRSMVPAEFVLVEDMPLSPNGKIDRHALGSRA